MSIKYCSSCGEKVDSSVKFCPNCRSTSFKYHVEPAKVKPTLIQSLFYWQYNGKFILSRSKTSAILLFIIFAFAAVSSPIPAGMILLGLIVSLIVYLAGYLVHILKGRPTDAQLENSDLGFIADLKNMFFFWQNKRTGEYVLSKTKILTFAVYILIALIAMGSNRVTIGASFLVSIVFTAPVYAVGFVVHKLTNPNPENPRIEQKPKKPKVEKKRQEPIPEPTPEPPQMTNTKFVSVVDSSTKIFNKEADSISSIISLATEKTPRVEEQINKKFEVLNSLIDKMDDLINELVLSLDSSKKDDVHGLLDEMENLVDSVKNYE